MVPFYAHVPAEILGLSHRQAVARYAEGAAVPGAAITGLSRDQLLSVPVPQTWSIQQIVLHLMDADLIAAYRMKRIIAEDRPLLDVYDETGFADRLSYALQDAAMAGEIFRLNRLQVASVLRALPEEVFERCARHPEAGDLSLGMLVRVYVHHVQHHLRFLVEKRKMVEKH